MKDKEGNHLTFKKYMKLWGEGIKNLTPQQKVSNEYNATIVMLIGFIVALVALIIFREKLIVSWFAYGLILIFAGNCWVTVIKLIGFYQQKQFFKNVEEQMNSVEEEEEDKIMVIDGKEQKGMSTTATHIGKYAVKEKEVDDEENKPKLKNQKGGKTK